MTPEELLHAIFAAPAACSHGRPADVRCSECAGDTGDWWQDDEPAHRAADPRPTDQIEEGER